MYSGATTQADPAAQRGLFLITLEKYFGMSMATAAGLFRCLRIAGRAPGESDFKSRLIDLAESGYIEIFRANSMPGYAKMATWLPPDTIMFVKLLPIGIQMITGKAPNDPAVYITGRTVSASENGEFERRELRDCLRNDIEAIAAAAHGGDSLARDVISALVVDGLIMDHLDQPKARKKRTGRRDELAEQRGQILSVLETYHANGSSMTLVNGIFSRLEARRGFSKCGREGLDARLVDLAQRGYIEIFRANSLPWYRGVPFLMALQPGSILFAKLMPKGLAQAEGLASDDPQVRF